jgi:hypothetical protein
MILFNLSHLPSVTDGAGKAYQPSAQGMVQEKTEEEIEVVWGDGPIRLWEEWVSDSKMASS